MITGKARVAGVMGWPVEHSRSPALHGHWIDEYGLDATYIPFAVAPQDLEDALRALPKLGFKGCNVTVPHKEAVYALVDELDERARRIGAVNTVVVTEDGRLKGSNTDGYGFAASLDHNAPGWDTCGGDVVVLGAGGAALAIVAMLAERGIPRILLANRTRAKAARLVSRLQGSIEVIVWDMRSQALENASLLVNTTTLGMTGRPELEIDLDRLPKNAVVTDIVYVPLRTALLRAAEERGNPTVDGLGMLMHQARPGFQAWFGVDPEVTEEMRSLLLAGLAE